MHEYAIDLDRGWRPWYADRHRGPMPERCPRCREALVSERVTFAVATQTAGELKDTFYVGGNPSRFCEPCGLIAIDLDNLRHMLRHSMPHWELGAQMAVLGMIDTRVEPEDRTTLDDAPIIALDAPWPQPPRRSLQRRQARRRRKKKR